MIRQLTVRIIRMHIAIENTFDRIAITCVLRSSRMYRFIYDAQSITQFFQVVNEKIEFLYNICVGLSMICDKVRKRKKRKSAQKFLGQSDIEVTLEIYTHLSKFKKEQAIRALDEHLKERKKEPEIRLLRAL